AKRGAAGDTTAKASMARQDRAIAQMPVDPFQARRSGSASAAGDGMPTNFALQNPAAGTPTGAAGQSVPSTPVVGICTAGGNIAETPSPSPKMPSREGASAINPLVESEGPNPWDVDGAPAGAAKATSTSSNQNISRTVPPTADAVAQNQNLARA